MPRPDRPLPPRRGPARLLICALLAGGCGRPSGAVAHLPDGEGPGAPAAAPTAAAPAPAPGSPAPAAAAPTPGAPGTAAGGEAPAGPGALVLSGTTEPHRRSTLTPIVAGPITQLHVREGDRVRRGAPLVSLDLQDFSLRLRLAEAQRAVARVQVDAAEVEWRRTRALLADRAANQAQFDAVDARKKGADAALALAEVAVEVAAKALRDAVVRAPYDGVVTARHAAEGEYATVTPATKLVTLEEVDTLDVRLQVPETALLRVGEGARVRLRIASVGAELDGTVRRVVASADARSRTFAALLEIDNGARRLRPGLFVEATLGPPASAAPGRAR